MEKRAARELIKLAELLVTLGRRTGVTTGLIRRLRRLGDRSTARHLRGCISPPNLCNLYFHAVADLGPHNEYYQSLNTRDTTVAPLAQGFNLDFVFFAYAHRRWSKWSRAAEPRAPKASAAPSAVTRAVFQIGFARYNKSLSLFQL